VALIHQILRFEETLVSCIQRLEPQHLAGYATELATRFNAFYRDCRVLRPEDVPVSQARLKLAKTTQIALARALSLMGMQAPVEM
jgi:arginyl-tRNA synthetase